MSVDASQTSDRPTRTTPDNEDTMTRSQLNETTEYTTMPSYRDADGFHYAIGPYETASEAVTTAVTTAAGLDLFEVESLYKSIDPDALDQLVDPPAAASRTPPHCIAFTYLGHEVEIRHGRTVTVRDDADSASD